METEIKNCGRVKGNKKECWCKQCGKYLGFRRIDKICKSGFSFCDKKHSSLYWSKDPEWRRKNKEGCQKRSKDPEWLRQNKEMRDKMYQDPEWQHNHKEAMAKLSKDPEWLRKNKELAKLRAQDPEWLRKIREAAQLRAQDPEWIHKMEKSAQLRAQDPEWVSKMTKILQERAQDPEWLRKNKEAAQLRAQDPEWLRKNKEAREKLYNDPEWLIKQKEGFIGGFWYGSINNYDYEIVIRHLRMSDKYKNWVNIILERDKYTDVFINENKKFEVHHIKPFANIIKDYNIKTMNDAINCNELWDIDNGITMLKKYHTPLFHKMFKEKYGNVKASEITEEMKQYVRENIYPVCERKV